MSLEEIVKSLATKHSNVLTGNKSRIQNLEIQTSQLASFMKGIKSSKMKLPSQTKINPKREC
jgi:hypothetical protein